ncbi:leucine dehydrogenase [Chlamydia ibidis]|uniref:Leucine dehydrogenase n=2 Tax=Chlamydia ibidis TaxID=1405396 RepID=S7J342_9CHLA|nr:Glu/Leu/Phe/Val dehydrogenase [Chlamydia ibidis]EPP34452.1 leucine dehydrogenase [Chlamydia ibidis]EQM62504.1 leucine dehydrogenase [Chlamydia ibidis 10-1398/6]
MNYPLVFKDIDVPNYERVLEVTCPSVHLHAIIAIHQTVMGPSLGGVRAFAYNTFDDALTDALRLSRGMTYKAALSDTGTGGGKSVIILPKGCSRPTEDMLRAFGQAVNTLEGSYIAAEDLGVTVRDITIMHEETPYVCGIESVSGDPSIYTAHGVFLCIQETARRLWGTSSLKGKRIGIQGVGAVGSRLARAAFFEGADVIISDTRQAILCDLAKFYGATVVPKDAFPSLECDIFCPCAFGGVVNEESISTLRCQAIVGAANNQLENPSLGAELHNKGILYAPDYLVNAGGLLNVSLAVGRPYDPKYVLSRVQKLPEILKDLYDQSKATNQDIVTLSDRIVESKLAAHV